MDPSPPSPSSSRRHARCLPPDILVELVDGLNLGHDGQPHTLLNGEVLGKYIYRVSINGDARSFDHFLKLNLLHDPCSYKQVFE